MLLNKENLKNLKKKHLVLDVPEYDLQVNLQAMSLFEQLDIEDKSKQDKNLFVSYILHNCCVDDAGNKLFADADEVNQLPADLSLIIFKACLSLNSLGEKDVEKLAKNS